MRYRRPTKSLALAAVAALAIAAPVAIVVHHGDNTPIAQVDNDKSTKTTMTQVSLNDVPSIVLNVVKSGLADVGVTLPPIEVPHLPLPDVPLPPGLIPPNLVPSQSSATPDTPTASPTAPTSLAPEDAAGIPQGAVVKEIKQDKPFSMVGLTWQGESEDTNIYIRAKDDNGTWSKWIESDPTDSGADTDPNKQGSEPVWVGKTKYVQIAVTRKGQATPAALTSHPTPSTGATTTTTVPNDQPLPSGTLPTVSESVGQRANTTSIDVGGILQTIISTIKAVLINPGTGGIPGTSTPGIGAPPVITRAQWGADESKRCEPTYDPDKKAVMIHHTAGSNDYTAQESAEIVRGIYAYHTGALGWCDIGYNALVDKYGQIFEGAYGGLDKNVQGTHTGGFNKESIGVALMGNLSEVQPTTQMLNSVGQFLHWRLGLAHLNALGTSSLVSSGYKSSRYLAGQTATLPLISGHRDYGETECPGNYGYAALPTIRQIAATGQNIGTGPSVPATTDPSAANPDPLDLSQLTAIVEKFRELGGALGLLGSPQSKELTTPNGLAKYAKFDNGMIYWSKDTGAQPITGIAEQAWAAMGFENSVLGLPTSATATDGTQQITNFQGGQLVYDTVTGMLNLVKKQTPAPAAQPAPVPSTTVR